MVTLEKTHGQRATIAALRAAATSVREWIRTTPPGSTPRDIEAAALEIERRAAMSLRDDVAGSLRPVINATGVVVHTNLGRAPLAAAALDQLRRVASGYSNLEYDIEQGSRGSRHVHAARLLTVLTGAEAAVVVNNNAAATLLVLAGLAAGREVIISRGELVEIGGGFRVPEVMQQSGALLREVGTTNRTRAADYRSAIGEKTALMMRVHPSNFRIEGFTARPSLAELVGVARAAGIPLVEDQGNGCLSEQLPWEPTVQASLASGIDLVCFSADKLLGGPQAGIIAGRADLIQRLRQHPLMRALRVDKLTLAALEGTLTEHYAGRAHETVPVVRMLTTPAVDIERRARRLTSSLSARDWTVDIVPGSSAAGGGSAPGVDLATTLVSLIRNGLSANALEARLRASDPPVVARIENDHVVLDLRTVLPEQDAELGQRLSEL